MRDKLEKIIKAYEELEKKLSDPAVASDIKGVHASQQGVRTPVRPHRCLARYIGALDDIEAAKEMLRDTSDADEKEMLQMDISENEESFPARGRHQVHAHPGDPTTTRTPSSRFAPPPVATRQPSSPATLYKMYQRFCESRGWKTTVLDSSPSEAWRL